MAFLSVSFLTQLFQILLATYETFVALSLLLSLYLVWSLHQIFPPSSIPIHLYLPFLHFLSSFLFSFSTLCLPLLPSSFHKGTGTLLSLLLLSSSLFLGYVMSWLGKLAKSLFIFLFFSFLIYNYKMECGKILRDFVTDGHVTSHSHKVSHD